MREQEKIRRQKDISEAFARAGVLIICIVLGALVGMSTL